MILIIPKDVFAVTREEYNNAMVQVGLSSATTYQDDFVYTYRWAGSPENPVDKLSLLGTYLEKAKKGIKIPSGYIYGTMKKNAGIQGSFKNKFPVYCGSYVHLLIYHVSGGKVTMSDYENIKTSQLQKGDIIDFPSHIAIYLGTGNDNSEYTWEVIEASGKVKTGIAKQPLGATGKRIKESALSKLDYNLTLASYDYHDRLDDYAPIITSVKEIENTNKIQINATDYKHYDLSDKSDILEPENYGIVAYQVKTSSSIPTTNWKSVNKTSNLSITHEVSGNGTYYIFVKDVGGNVTTKQVNLTKIVIDKQKPTLGNFSYEEKTNSIVVSVNNATDNSGIKEYRFYIDNKLAATTANKKYEIYGLEHNKKYTLYYEVVDIYGNVSKSSNYEVHTEIDAKSIEVDNTRMYLVVGETQKISHEIIIDKSGYNITYKSSNENVCKVDNLGKVKAIGPGNCVVTIAVGQTKANVNVRVSSTKISFELSDLPVAYVDADYNVLIKTNPQGEITATTSLPDGLYIENNYLKGKPTDKAYGTHIINLRSKYNDSEADMMLILTVKYDIVIDDLTQKEFYIGQEANETINVNYPGSVTIIDGIIPEGMFLDNNVLVGTPTEKGEFTFTIEVEYMNSKSEKKFTISVVEDEVVPEEVEDETPIETEKDVDIKEQEEINEPEEKEIIEPEKKEEKKEDHTILLVFVTIGIVIGLMLVMIVFIDKIRNGR